MGAADSIRIDLNGRALDLPAGSTVADAAEVAGVVADERGVAVALDGAVVPRAAWPSTRVSDGTRVEVVRATAGG